MNRRWRGLPATLSRVAQVNVTTNIELTKTNDDLQMVFGWASVAITKTGEVVEDAHSHIIPVAELEKAAYGHVMEARATGVEHRGDAVGTLVESVMFTPAKIAAMGLSADAVHQGWWVGYKIEDAATWARVKSGELGSLSIQGVAEVV